MFNEKLLSALLVMKVCQGLTIYQPSQIISQIRSVSVHSPHETASQQPGHIIIDPNQYQLNKQSMTTSPKVHYKMKEQPAIADNFTRESPENSKKHTNRNHKPLFIDYHHEIYHLEDIERTSPLTNNKHWERHGINVRKQRNLRENHDKKVIEQNIEEMENANEDSDRQNTEAESLRDSSKQPSTTTFRPSVATSHETRYLHDIFLNYPKTHHINFGHVQLSPSLFQKHFESQKAGNRFKGEIMWLDNTGGYAQHYWDLAQGRL